MIALTSPYFWYTTRASGLVALVLFTLVVTLGMLVANRAGGDTIGRFELSELHRSLSLIAMVFLVLHILTTVVDSYVSTGLLSAFLPLTSSYKTLQISIGAISFDLLLAVWISSLVKLRLKFETWRAIHWLSWISYACALVHAYVTGSDAKHGYGLLLILLCLALVLITLAWRVLYRPTRAGGRTALSPLQGTNKKGPR